MTPGERPIAIPPEVREALVATQGEYYEGLSRVDRHKIADDVLSEAKARQQAELLEQYVPLRGARVLEVGTGLAMNLLVWSKRYGIDATGVEPDSSGFEASHKLARTLMQANGLDPERIVNAVGESLPFADATFDVVFSSNVLEHTNEPYRVLEEALRVLKPGGTMQFVFPNYRSYYDGHYGVFHPPVLWRGFFPWYVRWIWRRDPAFARTLRTELNAGWTRDALRRLGATYRFEVAGLGEDTFRRRMTSLDFGTWAGLGRVKRALELLGHPRVRAVAAAMVIGLGGWSPIILTLRKLPS